jgi:hypothetical protein
VIWHLLSAKGSPIEKRQAKLAVIHDGMKWFTHSVEKIEGQEQAVAA